MTNAEFARRVARITKDAAATCGSMAEGMWNPNFCAADAADYANPFLQDIRAQLDHIEKRMRDTAVNMD